MKAFVVVDLGFGDAGKGLLTDYLVRRHQAELVVRFNGGAQAGHNVVEASGRHHTFSQFGAGSFVPGVRTHLGPEVVVHPTALLVEAERLAHLGERDVLERLSIDPRCRVTTPYQQAAGRLRELLRADARHGSCGVGVGETVADSLRSPELTLRFGELLATASTRQRLEQQRRQKVAEFALLLGSPQAPAVARELELLQDERVPERWFEMCERVARAVRCAGPELLRQTSGPIVFEGAQGVLLDEDVGFHPFTTYSRCTPHGALALLAESGAAWETRTLGVVRAHMVRHGPGPFPTEDARVAQRTHEGHNVDGPWQGAVRKGWPDLVLLDYARRACGHVDALAVTHLDTLAAFERYRLCETYDALARLELPKSLVEQERLTERLRGAKPHYTELAGPLSPSAFCTALGERLALPVALGSAGPRAGDVFEA